MFLKNNSSSMTTIKELLGQGDVPKPTKNFLQENIKRLKEMKTDKIIKFSSHRNKNFQPVADKRDTQVTMGGSRTIHTQRHSGMTRHHSQPQTSASPTLARQSVMGRVKSVVQEGPKSISVPVDDTPMPKGYRSQGSQTLSGKQLETMYYEGVIRYPSARPPDTHGYESGRSVRVREMALQTEEEEQQEIQVLHSPRRDHDTTCPPSPTRGESGLHWDGEKYNQTGSKDFVKMNATMPEPQRFRSSDHSQPSLTTRPDPTRPPPTYQRGVVPRYLKEHKKELERERITKAKEASDECPEGHILLPDDIRLSHLTTLKQRYSELVSQLNKLPVSTDTLRTRTRKKQIETDLDKIEAAVALFSREKVFVKADS